MFGATALGQPAAAKPAFNFSLGGTTAGAAPAAGGLFGTTQPGETHCEHMSFFTGSVWTGPFLEKNDLLESSAYLKRPVVCDFTIITTITSFVARFIKNLVQQRRRQQQKRKHRQH